MESIDQNLVFLWRAVERFANVLIGALAIYLGYKLFMNLPERREDKKGEMKLMLPGDISVYVSRVGPGVFFALFGTAVVLMSFVSTLQIDTHKGSASMITASESPRTSGAPPKAGTSVSLSYVSGEVETDRFSTDRAAVQRDLVALRGLEASLNDYVETGKGPRIEASEANTLLNTLQRVKRSLLLSVWDDKWGDSRHFSQWIQQGAMSPPPAGMEDAAAMFTAPLQEEAP
jgi:hypothetical protein